MLTFNYITIKLYQNVRFVTRGAQNLVWTIYNGDFSSKTAILKGIKLAIPLIGLFQLRFVVRKGLLELNDTICIRIYFRLG